MQRLTTLVRCIAVAGLLLSAAPAGAEQASISIELNKLEDQGSQCAAYFVITNPTSTNYQEFKLDLVLFRPDGVIGHRFAIDLAPLKANKRTVKLFELADTACGEVGTILVNETLGCKSDAETKVDCLNDTTFSR